MTPVRPALLLRVLLTIAAAVLGVGLSLTGLHIRLFEFPPALPSWLGPWDVVPRALGLQATALGWPLLVIGLTWFGAVAGLWLRLSWGKPVTLILSAISALALGAGTALAAVVVACMVLWRPVDAGQPSLER